MSYTENTGNEPGRKQADIFPFYPKVIHNVFTTMTTLFLRLLLPETNRTVENRQDTPAIHALFNRKSMVLTKQ
jgi:hypothetical protein